MTRSRNDEGRERALERAGRTAEDGPPRRVLALKKKETPVLAKICAGATVAYALSPVDLIPDFIPVLGYLDDLIVLPALVALTMKLIPRDVLARCRDESAEMWRDGRPKRWRYALPIIALWLIVLYLIAKAIWL